MDGRWDHVRQWHVLDTRTELATYVTFFVMAYQFPWDNTVGRSDCIIFPILLLLVGGYLGT